MNHWHTAASLQQSHRAELARDAEAGTVSVAKAWGRATATRSAPGGGRTTATVVAQTGGSAILLTRGAASR